jgi:hypothetical protein
MVNLALRPTQFRVTPKVGCSRPLALQRALTVLQQFVLIEMRAALLPYTRTKVNRESFDFGSLGMTQQSSVWFFVPICLAVADAVRARNYEAKSAGS